MAEHILRPRLRAKLVASYLVVGVCVTLMCLLGGRWTHRQGLRETTQKHEVLRRIEQLTAEASSAAEEGFSFVLVGNSEEEQRSLDKFRNVRRSLAGLNQPWDLRAPGAQRQLERAAQAAAKAESAAAALFASFKQTHSVGASQYAAYEAGIDGLTGAIAVLADLCRVETSRELQAANARWDQLMLWNSVFAALVGLVFGNVFGRRITKPILALRDTMAAFGAGKLDAVVSVKSTDEIGELAQTFEKMAADTKRHLEQRMDDIFSSIDEALVVCSKEGKIVAANPSCCRISGYAERTLVGQEATFLFHSALPERAAREESSMESETVLVAADGREIPVRLSVSRLGGRSADGWVLFARDLSERNRLEAELRQAQKMEALGRFAGGIAHDFNNMLNIILGYAAMLLERLPSEDPSYAALLELKRAGQRSADLTRQLLAFSSQRTLETKIVDVNEVIESTSRILRRVLGEDIELSLIASKRPASVEIESGQLEQVLMNLVVNARDAMPRGGKLVIETSIVHLDETQIRQHSTLKTGRYVMLAVSDSGAGMDRLTQEKIFEPFFTTKDPGKGTGLGLSTVFGVVQRNGGHIYVYSELSKGSTFKLYLPLKSAVSDSQSSELPSPVDGRGETILLVEDEEQVRRFLHRLLTDSGYNVLAADHPEQALRLCESYGERIDLLLTDVIMPQMSGPQLAGEFLSKRPKTKVIYMSGYTSNVALQHGIGASVHFLQKPIAPDVLRRKLRSVLVEAPGMAN